MPRSGRGPLARGLTWVGDQLAFLIVLAGVTASFVYLLVEPGHWVRGTGGIAVSMFAGAVLRLVLPTARVGSLAVRSRTVDVLCYLVLGGLILAVDIRLRS